MSTATVTVTTAIGQNVNSSTTTGKILSGLSGGEIGGIVGGAVVVLIVLAGLLVFCFRRKSSDMSAVEQYPAAGYGNKQFDAPPFEYQQTNPVFNDIAGGRTHSVSAGTGGGWPSVNSDGVAGGRVGRPF